MRVLSLVRAKKVSFGSFPSVLQELELWGEKERWTREYFEPLLSSCKAAESGTEGEAAGGSTQAIPLLVSAAPTGSGKSFLVPLFLLHAHWCHLEARLQQTLKVFDEAPSTTHPGAPLSPNTQTQEMDSHTSGQAAVPFKTASWDAFARDFAQAAHIRIIVTQPTRLACVELCNFTAAALQQASSAEGEEGESTRGEELPLPPSCAGLPRQLFGPTKSRVGYACSGAPAFDPLATEIVFATTEYFLLALSRQQQQQQQQQQREGLPLHLSLRPTVLVVDEAHGRHMTMDILLTWVRLQRRHFRWGAPQRELPMAEAAALRLVVVLSATLALPALRHFFAAPLVQLRDTEKENGFSCLRGEQQGEGQQQQQQQQLYLLSQAKHVAMLGSPTPALWSHVWWSVAESVQALQLSPPPTSAAAGAAGHQVEQYFLEDLPDTLLQSPLLRRSRQGVEGSSLLGPAPTGGGGGSGSGSGSPRVRAGSLPRPAGPALFSVEGRREIDHLRHLFTLPPPQCVQGMPVRRDPRHYKAVASLALHLLELLPLGSSSSRPGGSTSLATVSGRSSPPSLLIFLPGMAEIQQVVLALEAVCTHEPTVLQADHGMGGNTDPAQHHLDADPKPPLPISSRAEAFQTLAAQIPVFRSNHLAGGQPVVFSVVVLHSATDAPPQDCLQASQYVTASSPTSSDTPMRRLLLATNIAESSLTIPELEIMIDIGLERSFIADATSGATRQETRLLSASSLWQRRGRVGRTGDGIALHLVPKAMLLPPKQPAARRTTETNTHSSSAADHPSPQIALATGCGFTPLPDSPATILLRIAGLFPADAGTMLAHLPAPLSPFAVAVALDELNEKGLWRFRTSLDPHTHTADEESGASAVPLLRRIQSAIDAAVATNATKQRLLHVAAGGSTSSRVARVPGRSNSDTTPHPALTFKGLFVAALPLPLTSAALVYHGLQFAVVEDALLLAAAMSVPSLHVPPRLFSAGGNRNSDGIATEMYVRGVDDAMENKRPSSASNLPKVATHPLHAFLHSLAVQRCMAGQQDVPGGYATPAAAAAGDAADHRPYAHLSEPLLLRDLLRGWYLCRHTEDAAAYLNLHQVRRSALRQVDWAVAQCCSRLLQLLSLSTPRLPPGRSSSRAATGDAAPSPPGMLEDEEGGGNAVAALLSGLLETQGKDAKGGEWASILRDAPPAYLAVLRASLARLHHAARIRAQAFGASAALAATWGTQLPDHSASRHWNLPQWYPPERRYAGCFRQVAQQQQQQQQRASRGRPLFSFAFGASEDRLCAAFVASFAAFTLHGEDGGHHQLHRRLIRNVGILGPGAADTCGFQLQLSAPQQQQGNERCGELLVTTEALTHALAPYLPLADKHPVGTSHPSVDVDPMRAEKGYCKEDMETAGQGRRTNSSIRSVGLLVAHPFQSSAPPRSGGSASSSVAAVAVFQRLGQAESRPSPGTPEGGQQEPSATRLPPLQQGDAAVLCCDTSSCLLAQRPVTTEELLQHSPYASTRVSPLLRPYDHHGAKEGTRPHDAPSSDSSCGTTVQLAPFGASLLWATWMHLQRLPIRIQVPLVGGATASKKAPAEIAARPPTAVQRPSSGEPSFRSGPGGQPVVTWVHSNAGGSLMQLSREALAPLCLQHLFPDGADCSAASTHQAATNAHTVQAAATDAAQEQQTVPVAALDSSSSSPAAAETLSAPPAPLYREVAGSVSVVGRLHMARGVHWHAQLPSVAAFLRPGLMNPTSAGGHSAIIPDAFPSCAEEVEVEVDKTYCPACFAAFSSAAAFEAHLYTPAHLARISHCVANGIDLASLHQLVGMPTSGTRSTTQEETKRNTRKKLAKKKKKQHYSTSPVARLFAALLFPQQHDRPSLIATETSPCVLPPHSFLNVLQWTEARSAPLAVAGSLRALYSADSNNNNNNNNNNSTAGGSSQTGRRRVAAAIEDDSALALAAAKAIGDGNAWSSVPAPRPPAAPSPSPLEGSGGLCGPTATQGNDWRLLQERYSEIRGWCAHYTWVLPVAQSASAGADASSSATASTNIAPLLVLAGYLSAATRHSCVALLMDATHRWVYGFMIPQRGGVWRLPSPMFMADGAEEALAALAGGRMWCGLITPAAAGATQTPQPSPAVDDRPQRPAAGTGLHWCSLQRCGCRHDHPDHGMERSPVHSALLLVLHELSLSARAVVHLADYVERVLAKLRRGTTAIVPVSSASEPPQRRGSSSVEALIVFLRQYYPAQSLIDVLRLVGCRFMVPPRHVVLESVASGEEEKEESHRRAGAAFRGDLRFTLPPVLPSRLPPDNFVERLEDEVAHIAGGAAHATSSPPPPPRVKGCYSQICAIIYHHSTIA
eukprot:gene12129-8350_t